MAKELIVAHEAALLSAPEAVARLGRSLAVRFPPREVASFGTVGLICTFLFVLAYHFTRNWLPALSANCLALTSTAGLNFAANRWFTFPGRARGLVKQAVQYLMFYALGLGVSSLALFSFLLLWKQPSHSVELLAALLASGFATAIRYITMTLWVFREEPEPERAERQRIFDSQEEVASNAR